MSENTDDRNDLDSACGCSRYIRTGLGGRVELRDPRFALLSIYMCNMVHRNFHRQKHAKYCIARSAPNASVENEGNQCTTHPPYDAVLMSTTRFGADLGRFFYTYGSRATQPILCAALRTWKPFLICGLKLSLALSPFKRFVSTQKSGAPFSVLYIYFAVEARRGSFPSGLFFFF